MVVLFVLLLLSLYVLGNTAQNLERFGRLYLWLLALNGLGLAFIAILIGFNAWYLIQQFRERVAGVRLTVRLVIMFVVLALVPVTIVYSFSIKFLRSGIDSWFDVQVEQALEQALELSRDSLGVQMRTLLRITENVKDRLVDAPREAAVVILDELRNDLDASELTLLSSNNRVIASSSADPHQVIPNHPSDDVLMQVRQGQPYVGLDPIGSSGLHVRVVVLVLSGDPAGGNRLLQALFGVADRIGTLADSVQTVYSKYRQLTYLRDPLKVSFILTLSLVLLLSVLTAVWAAFFSARRLTLPIQNLAEGTQAVALGNYSTKLPASGRDELGFLVRSFNEMTARLARARDQARRSQAQVENQRTYLQTVLGRISTGVVTLDRYRRLRTANEAARTILEVDLEPYIGRPLGQMGTHHPQVQQLEAAVEPHLKRLVHEWSAQFELLGQQGRKVLVCRGTRLPDRQGLDEGHVLVFDDVTALIRVQRDAAWGEVARRMAHEIKNPLTPIQLSAERLRRKYLGKLPPKDAELLDRSTHTIVQQVESMKSMVNAFADYANTPAVDLHPLDINALIGEVADLYRGVETPVRLVLKLSSEVPLLQLDASRLRQLLHNLIRNSLEAQRETLKPSITIRTRRVHEGNMTYVELLAADQGPGIAEHLLDQVFEPYVSSKGRNSGLGLAVVKKIVEEHNGMVRAANGPRGGAEIIIQFPVAGVDTPPVEPRAADASVRLTGATGQTS
jgi:nitrogen fixation/metabolism regulation signal transduction histidine kinase